MEFLSRLMRLKSKFPVLAHVLRLCVSALFFYVIAKKISWGGLLQILSGADPLFFTASCLTLLVNPWLLAKKFRSLLSSFENLPGLWALLRINFICLFYAIIVPTGVGVGILRWYQMGQMGLDKVGSSAVIVMERLIYLIITVVCVLSCLVLSGDVGIVVFRRTLVPVSVVSLLGLIGLTLFLTIPVLNRIAVALLERIQQTVHGAAEVLHVMRGFLSRFVNAWRELGLAASWGIGWQAIYCLRVYMIFLSLNVQMGLATVVWVASLVLFLQVLPVSYLGLGIRESAYAFVFIQFGLPPEQGVSAGLLSFLQMMLASLFGWILVIKDSMKGKSIRP